jgi:hypothetical protein
VLPRNRYCFASIGRNKLLSKYNFLAKLVDKDVLRRESKLLAAESAATTLS